MEDVLMIVNPKRVKRVKISLVKITGEAMNAEGERGDVVIYCHNCKALREDANAYIYAHTGYFVVVKSQEEITIVEDIPLHKAIASALGKMDENDGKVCKIVW